MHQEEYSLMSTYLNDMQLMALKVIPFHPRLLSTKWSAFRKNHIHTYTYIYFIDAP